MKTLLDERDRHFWRSWPLWATLGGLLLAMACIVIMGVLMQRDDTQRRLDASRIQSVDAIEQQIAKLREADAKSAKDRVDIKKDVTAIKEEIKAQEPSR